MPEPAEIKAVEMTRRIRDAHLTELEGRSPEERLAYYREKARQLHAELGRPTDVLETPPRRQPA
ncbi:MAG TPA: hypothetical protein VF017_08050 [Thermoanaerobaculia bacterium]|nr:hypothetical protein [Thermoanaerobaculia bacterium]